MRAAGLRQHEDKEKRRAEEGETRKSSLTLHVESILCHGRPPRADTHRSGCIRHPHPNAILYEVLLCLPTAPELPLQGNADFGMSAFFGQLSDKPLLACI